MVESKEIFDSWDSFLESEVRRAKLAKKKPSRLESAMVSRMLSIL